MRHIIWVTAVIFSLLLSTPAIAQELTIITEEYPPLSFIEQGTIKGASVEVVKEILRRLNRQEKIMMLPWARGYNLLKTQPNIILFLTSRTKERENLFHWVGPICKAKNVLYARKGAAPSINTLEDAKGVGAIATYKEDAREQMLKAWGFTNIDSSKSSISNLKKLISGRVDLWAYDNLSMPYIAERVGVNVSDLELVYTINEVKLYIAISKQTSSEIVQKWRATLDEIKDDGTLFMISKKWLPESSILETKASIAGKSEESLELKIYTEDSPPANYVKNGKPAGMSVEIVREILKRIGQKVSIEVVPWARGYNITLTRPNVALFSTTRLPQREKLFKWVGPLYSQVWGFYAKKGSRININSLEEAKKAASIGTYFNDAKEQFLKKKGFTNLVTTNKNISNIRHLLKGDIDLWVSSNFNMPYLAKQAGVNPHQLELAYAFRTVDNYIAFSKKTPDATVADWQQALDAIKNDGTYENILRK